MATPDQETADTIATAIDRRIAYLQAERSRLSAATARITEIDTLLAALTPEKDRIDPRRSPGQGGGGGPNSTPAGQTRK